MKLIIIVAHDPNLVIGKDGGLPWRYKEDLQHFKQITMGGTMIMGRGVFEELNEIPLPGRKNIVLSRTRTYENVDTYSSLEEALENIDSEQVFIIGGGVLYREVMDQADKLIVTEIKKEYEGETFFPEYRDQIGKKWIETDRRETDELAFIEYERA